MKRRVVTTYRVECVIEGDDEDQIQDYISEYTPMEVVDDAMKQGHFNAFNEYYNEEITGDGEGYPVAVNLRER